MGSFRRGPGVLGTNNLFADVSELAGRGDPGLKISAAAATLGGPVKLGTGCRLNVFRGVADRGTDRADVADTLGRDTEKGSKGFLELGGRTSGPEVEIDVDTVARNCSKCFSSRFAVSRTGGDS